MTVKELKEALKDLDDNLRVRFWDGCLEYSFRHLEVDIQEVNIELDEVYGEEM